MDWRTKLSDAKAFAAKAGSTIREEAREAKAITEMATITSAQRTRATIDQHWPKVQHILQEHLRRPTAAVLYDDKLIRRLLPLVYADLPLVVRVVIEQDEFVQFCMDNRHRLLLPADDAQAVAKEPHSK